MSRSLTEALFEAAASTFERTAFLYPDPRIRYDQGSAPATVAAQVDFRGARTGSLVVTVTESLMPLLAGNMLGDESAPEERLQRDALAEIANMICGNVAAAITPGDVVLSPPRVFAVSGGFAAIPAAEVQVGLEGGRADLRLFLQEAGVAA